MMAVAGAFMVLSRLPSLRWGNSRSLPAFDFTNTKRAGKPLLAVGPISARATSSLSMPSSTSRGSQARCVRAARNDCSSAASSNRIAYSFSMWAAWRPQHEPRSLPGGVRKRAVGGTGSHRPHLLYVRAEVTQQVLNPMAQGGRGARAAQTGAPTVPEHHPILEAVEDDVAAVVGDGRPHARIQELLDGLHRACVRRIVVLVHVLARRVAVGDHGCTRHVVLHDGTEDG